MVLGTLRKLHRWRRMLKRYLEICTLRKAGLTLQEIGDRFGFSRARACALLRKGPPYPSGRIRLDGGVCSVRGCTQRVAFSGLCPVHYLAAQVRLWGDP
jgi:hypothetical protein